MKQKIKIMEQRPQLSDEEIRSYMNFDRLMADKKLVASKPKYHYLKWVAPAIALTGLVAWLIFNYPAETIEHPQNVIVDDAQPAAAKPSEPATSKEEVASSPRNDEPKVADRSAAES